MKFIRRHLLTAYAIAAFAYLLVPIAIVIAFSFNNPKGRYNYTWQGFTFRQWQNWDAVPGLKDADYLGEDEFWGQVDLAADRARDWVGRMRAGDVQHDPRGGTCPTWCSRWTMCRIWRA